MQVPIRGHI
jgi:hypothetical protein